jgi:hypothetical protein
LNGNPLLTFWDTVSVPSKRLFDPWRWDWYAVPKHWWRITIRRCVIPHKSTDLFNITVGASNHGYNTLVFNRYVAVINAAHLFSYLLQ